MPYHSTKDLEDCPEKRSLRSQHDRNHPKDVIHHSDRKVQYLSIRYTDNMTGSGVIASISTTGDSYDNALPETVNSLYKSELIHYLKESWSGINDVELVTLEWVD